MTTSRPGLRALRLATPRSRARVSPLSGARLTAAAAAAALLLAGCAGGGAGPTDPTPTSAGMTLHPHGPQGRWMDDAYAKGIASAYVTSNDVCAVTRDLSIELEREATGRTRVVAHSLAPGAQGAVWQIDDALCFTGALLPGDPDADAAPARTDELVIRTGGIGDTPLWRLVEPTQGILGRVLPVQDSASSATPLTWVGSDLVLRLGEEGLISARIGDGVDWRTGPATGGRTSTGGASTKAVPEVWTAPVATRGEVTVLADGMAGVTDGLGDSISVIDLTTGRTRFTTSVPRPDWITWASDGYVQKIQETDPEYVYVDLDGTEVDRTSKVSQYRFVPSPEDGVTFPIADHRQAGRVVGVDASGRPVLFQDDRQRDWTQDGEVEELPDSIIMLQGVTANGSLMLFDEGSDGGVVLIDGAGKTVASWPLPGAHVDRIESGRIVLTGESGTWVLRPGR